MRTFPERPRQRRFVRYKQLKPEYGIDWSREWIDEQIRRGLFPQKVHLGTRTIGWWSDELEDLLEARAADSRKAS